MPSDGRWRHSEIVTNPPSRAEEISGGIKNALDRGESLTKAKQSFINSGYTPKEVQEAAQMMQVRKLRPETTTPEKTPSKKSNSSSKTTIIILSIVGAVILIITLILGLFWDKIFGA